MKIIYNIPNIIRMAGMERILAIKANYLAGLTGMEVVIITYEQKNLPLAFDFSDKIRFYDLDTHNNLYETPSKAVRGNIIERKA